MVTMFTSNTNFSFYVFSVETLLNTLNGFSFLLDLNDGTFAWNIFLNFPLRLILREFSPLVCLPSAGGIYDACFPIVFNRKILNMIIFYQLIWIDSVWKASIYPFFCASSFFVKEGWKLYSQTLINITSLLLLTF